MMLSEANLKRLCTAWGSISHILERQNYRYGEQVSGCQGLRVGRRCWLQRSGMREFWGVMELFCILIVMKVTLYIWSKLMELYIVDVTLCKLRIILFKSKFSNICRYHINIQNLYFCITVIRRKWNFKMTFIIA